MAAKGFPINTVLLKRVMLENQISNLKLADLIDVPRATISKIRNGYFKPSEPMLIQIGKALGINYKTLLATPDSAKVDQGDPLATLPADEAELVSLYRTLGAREQHYAATLIGSLQQAQASYKAPKAAPKKRKKSAVEFIQDAQKRKRKEKKQSEKTG